ncbi:MAG: lysophospholipid acyltransferase family protein [Victivallaceae bacterium]
MSCKNNLFEGDSYDTPADAHRSWLDKLLLGCRFHFYLKNFYIFCQTGKCARRGELDQEQQVFFSNKNIRLVESCGGRIHLRGLDNLREVAGRPVILMGNHMSSLETALFHAIVRPHLDFTFVIKQSLLNLPYFGDIMRSLKAIPVGRANPREDLKAVLTLGKATLAEGRSIILFPQATRSEQFSPENFNSIGIKLARSADVEIIPFALKTDFLGNGTIMRDLGPIRRDRDVYFEFGKPMKIVGNGKGEHKQIIDFTLGKLKEWNHQ